jgi:cytochrome c oxidase subunit 1
VQYGRRLTLCHYWVAFAAFLPAVLLGAWQMLIRSPLPAPVDDPGAYYASVTLHGTIMAYVLTTFFTMGFGYAVAATTLGRPIRGVMAAVGFVICLIGTVMAAVPVIAGKASVLYTFYPPLLASAWYYGGTFLLIGGSMIWVVLMVVNMIAGKRDNHGKPVPLAMFAITATARLWAWAASGVLLELIGILLPRAFGWTDLVDSGLGRTLFSVTLHAIVYFWLMPAYVAFYTLLPQAAGGRLYSDTMGRLTFLMLLVFSLPVGMHHLLADPEHGPGFKFLQSFLTFLVALPTLLTVFSITAQSGDCRASPRRARTSGVDRGSTLGRARGAGRRVVAGHAWPWWVRRPYQHELRHELNDPQHVLGYRALPSYLWRRGGDHVFRYRL